jgi:hypothetical protein
MDKPSFIVYELVGERHFKPVKNKRGKIEAYDSRKEANEERIYLQPDYDNLLRVLKI